jgi:hypothetical protein
VAVEPYADLAGNGGDHAALPFWTTPALDFAAQDGFESAVAAVLRRNALIDDPKAPPAMSGARSLYLGAGNSMYAARLRVAPGQRSLRFVTRSVMLYNVTPRPTRDHDFYVDLAAPYGKLQHTPVVAGGEPFTPDPTLADRQLGTPKEVVIPLPADVEGEVMVRIVNDTGLWGDSAFQAQLDDLRVAE